jgi:hypothetical protein
MIDGMPVWESVPPRLSSTGEYAVELAARAGLTLDPWQAYALDQALGERPDGKWSAFEVAVIVPRQNGKGALLEARELAGLFLLGERLIIHTAHEFKTAQEAFRRIRGLIDMTPMLSKRVKRIYASHGDEGIELMNGQRLRFLARSSGSGRGFSGDCVILDEAYALTDDQMAAILPTLSARPNPQVWYTSSAGLAGSDVLRSVRDRGRAGGEPSLCYLEWCARPGEDGVVDPLRREGWAEANPGIGIRISEEFIEKEQRALGAHEFARERLGVWEEASDALPFTPGEWDASRDDESEITGKVAFAIECALDNSSSAIAVAGYRADGRVHAELVMEKPGSTWIASKIAALADKWGPVMIALDPSSPAGHLTSEILAAGVPEDLLHEMASSEMAASFSGLVADVKEDRFRHIGQDEITKALASAQIRPVGDGGRAWGRRKSSGDISALVALTSARWALREVLPEQEDEVWGWMD